MVLAINKIAKPGQRNFTIKSLARSFCGHRASPAKPKRRPPLIARRKITKVRLWLRELLFCTRRKIACCVFHLFWEKMHAISYSLFHWSGREISVQAEIGPGWACRQNFRQRGPPGGGRAERAERGGTRCLYLLERPCSHACLELEISMRTVLLLAAAAAAAACSSCGFNCDESCNCGHCSTKPGCSSSDKCMKNCNHGGTLPVALVSRKLCCAPLSLVFARFAHASQYEFRRS